MSERMKQKSASGMAKWLRELVAWYDGQLHQAKNADLAANVESSFAAQDSELASRRTKRSTYSHWPKSVQQSFGVNIFQPSEAKPFIRWARRFVEAYENISELKQRETVYISSIDAGASIWIPQALGSKELLADNPDVNFDIRVREWWQVIDDVRTGIADFGIATTMQNKRVKRELLMERPHMAFVSSKSKLAKKKVIAPADMSESTVVCLHSYLVPFGLPEYLRDHGVETQVVSLPACAQILSWLERTPAIAVLPIEMLPKGYTAVPLDPAVMQATDSIYTSTKNPLSDAAAAALAQLKAHWSKYR